MKKPTRQPNLRPSKLPPLLRPKGDALDRLGTHAAQRVHARDVDVPKYQAHKTDFESTLGGKLATAAHRLRYDAVLEAVRHMGTDVDVQEYRDYATCSRGRQFAAVRPQADGSIAVGIALSSEDDVRLEACAGRWGSERIVSQFVLDVHQPIRGWQLGMLRRAYLAAGF